MKSRFIHSAYHWTVRAVLFLVTSFAVFGVTAQADTLSADIRKVVWELGNDTHIFYEKTPDRWEAVQFGSTNVWGGYTKSLDGNSIVLQANATDFVLIDVYTKKVSLRRSGKVEPWGTIRNAYDMGGKDVFHKITPPPPPPMSKAETQQWMEWIAAEMSAIRIPYCYKESYGRGVGSPLSGCPKGQVLDAGLCYDQCKDGYTGVANSCKATACPSGWRDDGLFCAKPSLSVSCPSGFNDIGVSCAKSTYDRGIGVAQTCKDGYEADGGLCYPLCEAGSDGVGPVCWSSCPISHKNECGVGCATSHEACVTQTFDMVEAPVSAAISLITMGADGAMKNAAKAGSTSASGTATKAMANSGGKWAGLADDMFVALEQGLEVYDTTTGILTVGESLQAEIEHWVSVYSQPDSFRDATSKSIAHKVEWNMGMVNGSYDTRNVKAQYIREQWALYHLGVLTATDGFQSAGNVLSAVSVFDPTGLVNVANVYAKPVCGKSVSPPSGK